MSSDKVQNIIEIDDDKEEKLSKPALATPTKTERTSTLPLNFDQSLFPKLASLLRKSAEKAHKNEPIQIIESNSPRTPSSENISNKIQPLKPDGLQKQTSELTRYDPNSHHILVVEDTQPISAPQCPLISAPLSPVQSGKTSHQNLTVEVKENFVESLSVEQQNGKHNHQKPDQEIQIALESIIMNEAEETHQEIAQCSGIPLIQSEPYAPISEENVNKNIRECVQNVVQEKTIQGVAQENIKHQRIDQKEDALTQKANLLMKSPEKDHSQPANNLNEDEIEPQSMEVQKPQSDAHSSFFAVQPSVQEVPVLNAQLSSNGPGGADTQNVSLDNSFPKNQQISAIRLQNVQEQAQTVEKDVVDNQPVQKEAVDSSFTLMPSQIQMETQCIDKMPQTQSIQPEQNNKKPQIQPETRPQPVVSASQQQPVQFQMPTSQIIRLMKQKIILQLPEVRQNMKTFSDEEILQIHTFLEEKNINLCTNGSHQPSEITQGISKQQSAKVAAQSQSVLEPQKQKSAQQFEDLTDSINRMNQPKSTQSPEMLEELDAIQQFEKLKNVGEEELRRKMAQYFPDSKDSLSSMNFQELQKMVNIALAELTPNPNKEQEVQSPFIQLPIIENVSDKSPVQINIDTLAENTSITKNTQQSHQINELVIPSLEQLRASLSQKLPQLAYQLRSISDKELRQIVISHAGEISGEVKQKDKAQQKDTSQKSLLLPSNPSIEQIVNQCSKWYPDLADDFKNIGDEHVKQIYENVIVKLGIGCVQAERNHSPKGKQSEKHGDFNDKSQKGSSSKKGTKKAPVSFNTNLKRTYQDMTATNSREDVQRKDKKKKYTSVEIRNILICKLPQLKPNIMTLDDNQIERIFYQSIDNGKNQNSSHTPSKVQQKIHEPSKSPALWLAKNHSSESIQTNKATIFPLSTNDNAHSAQVFETFDEKRQKKTRTVILVHTEVDCSEGQALSKMSKTNNDFVKRCNCDCCKKLDVNELLHRLGDLLEEKK